MTAPASNDQRDTLAHRLSTDDALLHVTMARSSFNSTLKEFTLPSSSNDAQPAPSFGWVDKYAESNSYATVPISVKPGTGNNLVHQRYRGNITNPPSKLCSATARLLDLQTLLELPLAVLGILLQQEQSDTQQTYLWPDRAKVAAIEVVRLPRQRTRAPTVAVTLLTLEDFTGTVWDFVQPEQYTSVIIHIQTVSESSHPLGRGSLQRLLEKEWLRGRSRKEANASIPPPPPPSPPPPPPPRDPNFRNHVKPTVCVITGASDVSEGAHIISRALNYELVKDVMLLLFGSDSPSPGAAVVSALFHRQREAAPRKADDPDNGILLSPSLHAM